MFYFIIFIILFLFTVLERTNLNNRSKNILLFFSWFILVVVAGTRYETGADWDMYTAILHDTKPIGSLLLSGQIFSSNIELGYLLLCSILKQVGLGIQFLFFIIVLFNVTIITLALKHYTKYVIMGLWIYFSLIYITLEFSLVRQALAASICFYAYRFVSEKKMWKYFMFVFIAFLFHLSALIMLPLYFFFKGKFNNSKLLFIVGLGCVLMLFNIKWIHALLMFIGNILGGGFLVKIQYYTTNETYNVNRAISIGFFLNLLLVLLFLRKRKVIESYKYGNLFINVFMVNIIVYYYLYEFMEISIRFRLYYIFSLMVLFPYLLESYQNLVNKIMIGIFIFIYCMMTNIKIYLNAPTTVVYNPYQNYFVYKILDKKSIGEKRIQENKEIVLKERKQIKDKNVNK